MKDKNEVKKELYKSKTMAKFSHYVGGNLYYTVELADGIYQFPIATVEHKKISDSFERETFNTLALSSDLGTTTFEKQMKGSDLNRWISKAIDKDEFIEIQYSETDTLLETLSREELIKLIKQMD